MNIILFAHGGSGNHGCEAIVRSTCSILKKNINNCNISIATYSKEEDIKYGIKEAELVEYNKFSRASIIRIIDKLFRKYFKSGYFRKIVISDIVQAIEEESLCFSIGGDNYSYTNVIPFDIIKVHEASVRRKCSTILWGCSIDECNLEGAILNDLKNYDLIVARESLTYNALLHSGISNEKVRLYPDPAFVLEADYSNIPYFFSNNEVVGINLSPVVIENEKSSGIVEENYYALIDYILEETDFVIALIPHVVWSNSDDRKTLEPLYKKYISTGRVFLIEDTNACQLKGIISKCRFFIGARTHSTIAAYSTGVPTLVLGYSVKARGIALDLFGTYENYVISTQDLSEKGALLKAFIWLMDNEESIRKKLNLQIQDYSYRVYDAGAIVNKLEAIR